MQLLQKRSTLEKQSGELLGYLDGLFRRLVVARQPADDPMRECTRDEIRLMILLRSRGSAMMSDIAAELGVPLSTATHAIDRMVTKGLVMRVRSEKDRRIVQVELSDLGRGFQAELRSRHQAMARSWLAPLSPAERDTFLKLMGKIAHGAKAGASKPDSAAHPAAAPRRISKERMESARL